MHLRFLKFVIVICISFVVTSAEAATPVNTNSAPKIIAIQKREYTLSDEITLAAGYEPLDSFNRYVTYGGSYTHFFNDYLGWEILNINDASNSSSGLSQTLVTSYNVSAFPFNTLSYYATSNIIYTPIFNKSLLLNSTVTRGETSLALGGGVAKFDSGYVNMVDAGVIFRFFISRQASIKFDFRYDFYFNPTAKNNINLGAGFAFNFGKPNNEADIPKEPPKEKDPDADE